MIAELDCVALTVDLPENGLAAGDVGAVVHVHGTGEAYEVEFVTFEGNTVALLTLSSAQVRRLNKADLHHARRFERIAG